MQRSISDNVYVLITSTYITIHTLTTYVLHLHDSSIKPDYYIIQCYGAVTFETWHIYTNNANLRSKYVQYFNQTTPTTTCTTSANNSRLSDHSKVKVQHLVWVLIWFCYWRQTRMSTLDLDVEGFTKIFYYTIDNLFLKQKFSSFMH